MKLIIKRTSVIVIDALLFIFFTRGFFRLVGEPVSVWLLLIYVTGLVVSGLLLIGWLIPKIRRQIWFWRTNLLWTIGWSIYFCVIIGILIIAINRLASLG